MTGDPIDLDQLRERLEIPDRAAAAAARARYGRLTLPADGLGRLADAGAFVASVQAADPPRAIERPRVVVFAADHGVTAAGVSVGVCTERVLAALADGDAPVAVFARGAGAGVRVEDLAVASDTGVGRYKIAAGNGRIDREDALSVADAERAFAAGVAIADDEIDSGTDLLLAGAVGTGQTTPAAVLVAASLNLEPTAVTGRGSGIDDAAYMRKVIAVRDALRRSRERRWDPMDLVACVGGADFAALMGFLIEAAVRRTPVVLDGVVTTAAGLLARDLAYDSAEWWLASHRSPEPAHGPALDSLGLTPLLDLDLRTEDGSGGAIALPLIAHAVAALREVATVEGAQATTEEQDSE